LALWGVSEAKGVWRKERSERHQRTLKPFSRNQISLRHHSNCKWRDKCLFRPPTPPPFFFTPRARAGTQGMLREAQSARKRQGKADKGRNRAQRAEKGSKGPERGPKSRSFFF
jgi:hypothetical protein